MNVSELTRLRLFLHRRLFQVHDEDELHQLFCSAQETLQSAESAGGENAAGSESGGDFGQVASLSSITFTFGTLDGRDVELCPGGREKFVS